MINNYDIFDSANGFDMVVALTQQSINSQIAALTDPDLGGIIKTTIIMTLQLSADKKTHTPTFYNSFSDVPKGADGKTPTLPAISATYMPSITINKTDVLVLLLTFSAGSAWFNTMDGPQTFDMSKWTYGIQVDLTHADLSKEDIESGIPAPAALATSLSTFNSDGFAISHFFADLNDTNLLAGGDANYMFVNDAGDDASNSFGLFMGYFLTALKADPKSNPYTLGYAVKVTDSTTDPDANVPDSLKPTDATFTLYKDPNVDGMNNINFTVITKGGQGVLKPGSLPSPGLLPNNWLTSAEFAQYDGKLVYSCFTFVETLLLMPFYNTFANNIYKQLHDNGLDIKPPPASPPTSLVTNGVTYTISDVTSGDDQYSSSFTATWDTSQTGTLTIALNGHMSFSKTENYSYLGVSYTANKTYSTDWNDSITFTTSKNATGDSTVTLTWGTLALSNTSDPDPTYSTSDSVVIKALEFLFGPIVLGLEKMGESMQSLAVVNYVNIPNPNVVLTSLNNSSTNTRFILPAGQEFFFSGASFDAMGDLELDIKIKTESQQSPGASAAAFDFIDTPHSRLVVPKQHSLNGKTGQRTPNDPTRHATTNSLHQQNRALESNDGPLADPNALALPLTDTASLTNTTPKLGDYSVNISSELTNEPKKMMPISTTTNLSVVQDALGQPLIFSRGSDASLNILTSVAGSNMSGYNLVNLLDQSAFSDYSGVVSFAVTQAAAGPISLAMALSRKDKKNPDVFLASEFSNDLSKTDLSSLSKLAVQISGLDSSFSAQQVSIGTSDNGLRPLVTIIGNDGSQEMYYQLPISNGTPSTGAIKMKFPENLDPSQTTSMSVSEGFVTGSQANYFLYDIGQSQSLVSQTIPASGASSLTFDYSPGQESGIPSKYKDMNLKYSAFATAYSGATAPYVNSDLYIAADQGVFRCAHSIPSKMETVTTNIKDAHAIAVSTSGLQVSLWVMASPDYLYYIRGTKNDPTGLSISWAPPILFAQGVLQVTSIRKLDSTAANELYTVGQDSSITHFWQDPGSTNWLSKTAFTSGGTSMMDTPSYVTQLHFQNNGLPSANLAVDITSSEWQYCIVNGLMYSLDTDNSATVQTDSQGNIRIVAPASDTTPPILHVQSTSFSETMNIYPNGKVMHYTMQIQTGSDLNNARCQDGTPFVDPSIKSDDVDAATSMMTQVTGLVTGDNQFPPTTQGRIFTVIEKPSPSAAAATGVKHGHSRKLNASQLPNQFAAGFASSGGRLKSQSAGEIQTHFEALQAQGLLGSLGDDIGSFWQWIKTHASALMQKIENQIVTFADDIVVGLTTDAKGMLNFFIKIAGEAYQAVLNTLDNILHAVHFFFQILGREFGKLLRLLGFQNGWDRVWATHKMLASMTTSLANYGETIIDNLIEDASSIATTFFLDTEKTIKSAVLSGDVTNLVIQTVANSSEVQRINNFYNSSQGYLTSNILHSVGGELSAPIKPSQRTAKLQKPLSTKPASNGVPTLDDDPIKQFVTDVIDPAFEALKKGLGKDSSDLLQFLQTNSMDNLRLLLADVAGSLMDVASKVVSGLLKFVKDLLHDFIDSLTGAVDSEILQDVWAFIAAINGSDEPLTVVNAISLLISMPAATIMQLAKGQDPSQYYGDFNDSKFGENLKNYVTPFLSGGSSPQPQSVAGRKQANSGSNAASIPVAAVAEDGQGSPPQGFVTYSQIGGFIAPTACIVASIAATVNDMSEVPSPTSVASVISAGAAFIKGVFSLPVPTEDQAGSSVLLRFVAWGVTLMNSLALKLNAKAAAVVSGIVAVLAIVADIVDKPAPIVWASDIGGNIASCVTGLAPVEQPEIKLPALGLEIVIGDIASMVNALNALKTSQVVQYIPPAGA